MLRGKQNPKEQKSLNETEEIKYLRIHMQQLAAENQSIRHRLEDQKETSIQNKRLLGIT